MNSSPYGMGPRLLSFVFDFEPKFDMDIMILCHKWCDYSSCVLGYSKYTIDRYRQVVGYFHNFSHINNVEEITEENLRSLFFYGRTERKWSTNTYSHYHKTLLVFLRFCIKNGCDLKKNFMEDIEKPKIEKRLPPKLPKQEDIKNEEEEKKLEYKLGCVLREIAVVDESTINSTYEIITGYPRIYSLREKEETKHEEYKKVGIYGYNISEI